METVDGKVAFITGGGSGIGLSLGKVFAKNGARVVLADRDSERLTAAKIALAEQGLEVETVACDVANAQSVKEAAEFTLQKFGKVHIVVNNAGVSLAGKPGEIPLEDWRWIVDINLMGVVHGVEVFTPLIKQHGEGGYLLNTASMAGHLTGAFMSPYNATKFAVVGYSETIVQDLAKSNIGVSVLCPAWVRTDIHNTGINKPSVLGAPAVESGGGLEVNGAAAAVESGIDPDALAQWAYECVLANRFYIFSHPSMQNYMEARAEAMKSDYQAIIDDGRFADR